MNLAPRQLLAAFVGVVLAAVALPSPASASGSPPVAVHDAFQGRLGQKLEVVAPGLLANDTDPEGDRLTVRLAYGPPSYGVLDLEPDGSFLYHPNPSNPGYDSFAYQAFDGTSWSTPAWVSLTLWGDPVAYPDRYGLLGARSLHVPAEEGLLANDYGQPARRAVQVSRPTEGGKLLLSKDGSFDYSPRRGFVGTDSFTYAVRDGAGVDSKPALVTIRVAHTNIAPVAHPDAYDVLEDSTLVVPTPGVLANDVDADGHSLRIEVVDYPAEGSLDIGDDGSFRFQTDPNQDNNAFFSYRVTDDFSWSEPVTVFIDVIAVNDPPIAEPDAYSVAQDTVLVEFNPGVLANDHDDIEFDEPIVWALVYGPSHGKLSLEASGGFVYEPESGYVGPDQFVYRVGDVGGPGGTAYVDVDVFDPT